MKNSGNWALFLAIALLICAHPVVSAPPRAAAGQMVFMLPVGQPLVPSPGAIYEIATMNLDGSGFQQLTNDGKFKFLPRFSPDGTRIAYLTQLQGGTLWTIAPDGSNPQKVASAGGAIDDLQWGDPAWSRDDWILFGVLQNVNGCTKVRTDKIRD